MAVAHVSLWQSNRCAALRCAALGGAHCVDPALGLQEGLALSQIDWIRWECLPQQCSHPEGPDGMFSFSGRRGRTQGRTIRRGSAGGRGVITDQIGIIYTPKERERERKVRSLSTSIGHVSIYLGAAIITVLGIHNTARGDEILANGHGQSRPRVHGFFQAIGQKTSGFSLADVVGTFWKTFCRA